MKQLSGNVKLTTYSEEKALNYEIHENGVFPTALNLRFQPLPWEKHGDGLLVFPIVVAELAHQFPLFQKRSNDKINTDDDVDQDR